MCGNLSHLHSVRGIDPYGTSGIRPPSIWTEGHYHNGLTQYLRSNINFLTLSTFCYFTVYVIYLYSAVN